MRNQIAKIEIQYPSGKNETFRIGDTITISDGGVAEIKKIKLDNDGNIMGVTGFSGDDHPLFSFYLHNTPVKVTFCQDEQTIFL
ncbi:hypothetical protein GF406_05925 [candidate division KSB1 bacterium]|jgi:hypothetical protein|nr:hypothetical protein [candidate division KSB1 bacterium]